ncbi:hypothetical protein B0H14DRAFT_3158377 [Mycena olivaceomarginata]|nr:hypothetical protein B0H14DRAFT_3158377 [Mycena olivaceomarginata]
MPSDVEYPAKLVIFNAFLSIKSPVASPPRVWLMVRKNSVSSELLASAGRKFPRSNFLLARTSSAHQAPVRTLRQRYPHFYPTDVPLHIISLTTRSLAAASLYFSCFYPPRIGRAVQFVRMYLLAWVDCMTKVHCPRAVVGRRRASAPARPIAAGGSMTNVCHRGGTSDGAGHLRLVTVRLPWCHCWWLRSANECYPEALANAAAPRGIGERLLSRFTPTGAAVFPRWGKASEVWRQCRNGSATATLHSPQWGAMTETSGVVCKARGWGRALGGAVPGAALDWFDERHGLWCGEGKQREQRGGEGEVWRGPHGTRTLELQRGQYGMCRQESRGCGGVHEWSIAEALPGAAAHLRDRRFSYVTPLLGHLICMTANGLTGPPPPRRRNTSIMSPAFSGGTSHFSALLAIPGASGWILCSCPGYNLASTLHPTPLKMMQVPPTIIWQPPNSTSLVLMVPPLIPSGLSGAHPLLSVDSDDIYCPQNSIEQPAMLVLLIQHCKRPSLCLEPSRSNVGASDILWPTPSLWIYTLPPQENGRRRLRERMPPEPPE